jgi:uroporphyrinogen decarboxylase
MNTLFLRALSGEVIERTPLWIMRQAGRYLPEYRAVREKVDFLTLCQTPDLAAEVTLQPLRRFNLDAAILFSDIMTPLLSAGVQLEFNPGPVVQAPLRSINDVEKLRVLEPDEIAPFVNSTIKILRRELKVPLIGFAGAPLTLAAYLVQGKGSKDFSVLRSFLYQEPQAAHLLFDKLAVLTARYLQAQIDAGAQAVQLFDSWAGILSEEMYRKFALPAVQKIFANLAVPRIYFAQDAAHLWPAIKSIDVEGYGIDWRTSLNEARNIFGNQKTLQGNLDPAILKANKHVIRHHADNILQTMQKTSHIFNLGHGIEPDAPVEHVSYLVECVHEISKQIRQG